MSEPTLEELRPREWQVSWQYPSDLRQHRSGVPCRWFAEERPWPDQDAAVTHARALDAMATATGEIRNIEVHSRMTALAAGEWVPVVLWEESEQ